MTHNDQDKKDRYDQAVYKRLELVEKQFAAHQAEQRKQEASERRREKVDALKKNRIQIGRAVVYCLLGIILLAVIVIAVRGI